MLFVLLTWCTCWWGCCSSAWRPGERASGSSPASTSSAG
uniref:Uncharacterized protein n=1 Tax=Anguilla anguilla TaxID=7936 RepID=A0A0E9P7S9_ANGAN